MKTEIRAAIAVHHTDTSDASWDGPANEARLKTDQSASYYKRAFAWQDPEGDEGTKATYKFPHHEVDGDGNIGAANLAACSAGIASLNGGRSAAKIPDEDRQGVYNHLRAHLVDGHKGEDDYEPPALRDLARPLALERRAFAFELRSALDGESRVISGHAAVFNQLSEPLDDFWGVIFREQIAPGAFAKTIQEADIRALFNHNPDYVLGRNRANTLTLSEDSTGLAVEVQAPEASWARDLMRSMQRGDINQMSFGFQVVKDTYTTNRETKETIRTLQEVRLFDVSVVTYPAYPQTDASVRAALAGFGLDADRVAAALIRSRAGEGLSHAERDALRAASCALTRCVGEPDPAHSGAEPGVELHSLAMRRRRLELLALA